MTAPFKPQKTLRSAGNAPDRNLPQNVGKSAACPRSSSTGMSAQVLFQKRTFQYLRTLNLSGFNPFRILTTNQYCDFCFGITILTVVITGIPSNVGFAEERQGTSTNRVTENTAEEAGSVESETSASLLSPEKTFEQLLSPRESNLPDYDSHIPHPAEESTESREPRVPAPKIITRGFKDQYVERGGTWMRIIFASAQPCFPCLALGEKYIGTKFSPVKSKFSIYPPIPDLPSKVIVGPKNLANVQRWEYTNSFDFGTVHQILITGLKPNTSYHGLIFALDDKNSHGSLVWGSLVDALHPLEFKFATRSRATTIDFWKIHVINDGDGFSKGEGELDFQMFAKYKVGDQEIISKTPRIHNDLSDGESWLIGCKTYVMGPKTFQLFAAAHEEDGTYGFNENGTMLEPITRFTSDYWSDRASDGMTVNVADKWQVINDQVKEGYQSDCVIKVDGCPHDVVLTFHVHAKVTVMYWDMGLPWYSSTFVDTQL